MRVGLNATCLNDRPSGAQQRFRGIYGALIKQLGDTEFVVFEPEDSRVSAWFAGAPNVTALRTTLPSQSRLERFVKGVAYWKRAFRAERLGLIESFHLPLVVAPHGRTVLTVHDVRGLHSDRVVERGVFAAALWNALTRADHVITVSHAMKRELEGFCPRARFSVLYNGIDAELFRPLAEAETSAVRERLGLPTAFLLGVGHFEPRKNYPRLVEAVDRLKNRGLSVPLVIVGNDSGERALVARHAVELGLSLDIWLLSGLSDNELRALYQSASLFVFPSIYEGFGIPVLEAMAAGCPMVLSDLPVFRELTQEQGIYFQPDDVEAMSSAIERALTTTSDRRRAVDYGHRRVLDFTFPALAGQLATLHRTLI